MTYVVSGTAGKDIAHDISHHLNLPHYHDAVQRFSDGEIHVHLPPSAKQNNIILVQSTCPPTQENFMELLFLADAAKKSGAPRVTAVIPYYGYSRQNIKNPGSSASGYLLFTLLKAAGVHDIITMDLHAPQSYEPFFPVHNIESLPLLWQEETFLSETPSSWTFVAPDNGGISKAQTASQHYAGGKIAVIHKKRTAHNICTVTGMDGSVQGKNCIILDDIIDTGKTLYCAAEFLKKNGAHKIWAFITHGIFSGEAEECLQRSYVEKIFITSSIPQKKRSSLFHVVESGLFLAQNIQKILMSPPKQWQKTK